VSGACSTDGCRETDKDNGKSAIRSLPKKTNIGILLYSGATLAVIHGLTDLFDVANRFSAEYGGEHPAELQVSHWGANPIQHNWSPSSNHTRISKVSPIA
jgi:hypothetical protein